jgi:RNA polymerase sigma factor (sigma-70 family)
VYTIDFQEILTGCRSMQRSSQYRLHSRYYNYALSVARRYAGQDGAEEVVNDAFFKVFTRIHQFAPGHEDGFKAWLRRIVINTAIDRVRAAINRPDIEEWVQHEHDELLESGLPDHLTLQQILGMLDDLSPAYRTVFSLYIVDGYTHEEIADELGISIGTSKSNLARARKQLQQLIANEQLFPHRI